MGSDERKTGNGERLKLGSPGGTTVGGIQREVKKNLS